MINLFIPYYIDKASDRQAEIDFCVQKNIDNESINKVVLIIEDHTLINRFDSDKVICALIHYRPTYSGMFEAIGDMTYNDTYNVLINSDIYLDESIKEVYKYTHNDFLALSRWDVDKTGNAKHWNTWDSQDTWIFKGKPRKMDADFFQGIAGCDNAIADRAERAGYRVLNPSKTIKTYHLHNSGVRNYNPNDKVQKPYKFITPHE